MNRRMLTTITLCILLSLLSACEGGTSGSVRNASQSCSTAGGYGDCQGRLGRLSGTYGIDIEDEGISPGDTVRVVLTIAVESGSIRAYMEDPEGMETSVEVNPGMPATVTGFTQGDFDGFEFKLQALGEYAEGLEYSLQYSIE